MNACRQKNAVVKSHIPQRSCIAMITLWVEKIPSGIATPAETLKANLGEIL